jgi:hypothetical protein
MVWTDPRGEFGVIGALIGGGSNLLFQAGKNYLLYGDLVTALRCVDIKSVVISTFFGAIGVSPLKAIQTGGIRSAAGVQGVITLAKLQGGLQPVTIGDSCECRVPASRKSFVLDLIGSFQF